MTRTIRLLLLVLGLGIAASLVWRAGPRLIAGMLARVGRTFHRDQIAALRNLHPQPLLQANKIAAVAADKRGQKRVALEFQRDLLAGRRAGSPR